MADERRFDTGDGAADVAVGDTAGVEDDSDAGKGTYTLVVEFQDGATVTVGALGPIDFASGWYAYTGSAFGPGGFSRVERHRELAAGERDTRHWHVDYLLGHPETSIDRVVRTADADVECAVSRRLDGDRVPDFGASDCDCDSHLVLAPTREELIASVVRAHDSASGPSTDV